MSNFKIVKKDVSQEKLWQFLNLSIRNLLDYKNRVFNFGTKPDVNFSMQKSSWITIYKQFINVIQ